MTSLGFTSNTSLTDTPTATRLSSQYQRRASILRCGQGIDRQQARYRMIEISISSSGAGDLWLVQSEESVVGRIKECASSNVTPQSQLGTMSRPLGCLQLFLISQIVDPDDSDNSNISVGGVRGEISQLLTAVILRVTIGLQSTELDYILPTTPNRKIRFLA
ncbi:uncharacterized protein MELLADRAFT_61343 [Melampsora larici-populina 98AG31]|uniref:Uncharacterized protein n=1 Tax=Melampsora larici-populina (strain 98AG31 / pathotype 3-4-7) TaxID=747676 RepID=F4REI3_MELLP|nr:uncharacterized protein MELLADRAFT_61343 [Melampsora larici-populina 98AG31]EGG09266.1 hypothetical protein MELLADRAFT_61343 [Melampsora larici-populina 98AG31]